MTTSEFTPDEEKAAAERIWQMAGLLNQTLEIMDQCPFSTEADRVASVLGIMGNFGPAHYATMAGVAIERLHRLHASPNSVVADVKGGESFFLQLMAALTRTPEWVADVEREAKILSIAKATFSECSKEQLALLTAIGMTRLAENGLGPADD